jgi:hypothetical protein
MSSMSKSWRVALLCAAAALIAPAALAQSAGDAAPGYVKPKTPWGVPDLQGFWTNTSLTGMQRPQGAEKLVMNAEEADKLAHRNVYAAAQREEAGASKVDAKSSADLLSDKNSNRAYNRFWMDPGSGYATVKGELRSSWITFPADGHIPYSERGIQANTRGATYDDFETRPLSERCLMSFTGGAGPVLNNGMYNNTYQIVQTPTSVMILTEMIHDVRVIPIKGTHGPTNIPKWGGDSVGWYEGDTLVVETINSHPKQRSYIGPSGKVTERYTRWADGDIFYSFKVEDPTLYKEAWGGEMSLKHSKEPLYEYACHEGNYALPGILGGARTLERAGRPQPPEKAIFAGVDVSDGE